MEMILNNKEYQSVKKISGKLFDNYCETMAKIEKRQATDENGAWNREDLKLMREFLVEFYDHQFTEEALYNELEVASVIVHFLGVQKVLNDRVNSKLEKLAKTKKARVRTG